MLSMGRMGRFTSRKKKVLSGPPISYMLVEVFVLSYKKTKKNDY